MTKTIKMDTSAGSLVIELDDVAAPLSTANFLSYVAKGHYEGTVFHRVIKGFMLQGGGFEVGMKQKPCDAPIQNEANNGLKNKRYTLAMARTNDPHSATAQFFINTVDNAFLDHTAPSAQGWGYAVFARSCRAWKWSKRSRSAPAARAPTTTCRWKTCASNGSPRWSDARHRCASAAAAPVRVGGAGFLAHH
jgi:peptidyl-prolyl cis-trans isomerase B (cyclophilin B)